jgi:hypothetical protein
MTTAQPAGEVRSAPDIEFRSARKKVLWTSLALGAFVLLAVPIHSAFVADPGALADERYVWAACRLGNPLPLPGSVCPRVFAGESPGMVLYALIVVPLLLVRGRARTMLTIAVLGLIFTLMQVMAVFYQLFPPSLFPPDLNPALLPSPLERAPDTCGLVMCGLDHTLSNSLNCLSFWRWRSLVTRLTGRRKGSTATTLHSHVKERS